MNYYQFNKQEILQKAKDRYCETEAVEYYLKNKEGIKESKKELVKRRKRQD